ncbi:hypothetical protein PLICRDRAFT_57788 [Plicaturopsis crispa FD-325 SS-3]|uniref:Aminotransferase class I/classII large domain-containing protein n=1 Tax=Plicaturopsis crispa FD-325 SS-3 TaxID=944288 RepID=A0A0C9T881_PLICR|nr:hypothetical protein PLICRDRAFT_57788 [Plicaturopsis crispa FD-325 SS-3]
MSPLSEKLAAALRSREQRNIRRRLPAPLPPSDVPPTDFSSNDYLSLSCSQPLRTLFQSRISTHIASPETHPLLGSTGSRLLVPAPFHTSLERRLKTFFDAPEALLFNSGFDANSGFFACVPQLGDVVVMDAQVHASVWDGVRAGRATYKTFRHNSVSSLRDVLLQLRDGPDAKDQIGRGQSIFIAVESLYSMDGTFAPLPDIVALTSLFPPETVHIVVDEAHATGIYGPQGRGLVAMYGLEKHIYARLVTFGKALAGSGAVLLMPTVTRDYMLNYARPLVYTTALSPLNILAAEGAFDLLEGKAGGVQNLVTNLMYLSAHLLDLLRAILQDVPREVLRLPDHLRAPVRSPNALLPPIIPLLTPHPHALSRHLLAQHNVMARPIAWPTVPRDEERVRVCLRAGMATRDVEDLAAGVREWVRDVYKVQESAKL